MAEQRQDEVTPLQALPLACALAVAWKALWGAPPARESVLTLLAQIRHETGFRACHAYNLGNFKSVPGDGRDWVVFQTWERDASGAKVSTLARFRAYPSLEAGAADYLLSLRKRYGQAWAFVEAGDPAGFVRALKAQHYFTDLEASYEADVVRAFKLFGDTMQFDCDPPVEPALADVLQVAQAQQIDLAGLVDWEGHATRETDPAPPDPIREADTNPELALPPKRETES